MEPRKYKISKADYDAVIELIISGETNYTEIHRITGTDWKTIKRIYTDPYTHKMIAEQASDKLKNSVGAMTDILIDIAKFAERDTDRLTAIDRAMGLAGMNVINKQEVTIDDKKGGLLGQIAEQIGNYTSVKPPSTPPSTPSDADEEDDT